MVTRPPPDVEGFKQLPRGQKILVLALFFLVAAAVALVLCFAQPPS